MQTLAATDIRLFILLGIVIALVFIATVIIMMFRKKVLSPDQSQSTGLLMDDFRKLHAAGQLSDEEFQALRSRMAAKMKASTAPKGGVHDQLPRSRTTQVQRPQGPATRKPPPPSPPA